MPYVGEGKPLQIKPIDDFSLIVDKEVIFALEYYMYHPLGKDLIYNVNVSNQEAINAYVKEGQLVIKYQKMDTAPIQVEVIASDEDGKKCMLSFDITIIDPVTIKYQKVDNGLDYIEVVLKDEFYMKQDIIRFSNDIQGYKEVIDDIVIAPNKDVSVISYRVYLADDQETKVDFDPLKSYTYTFSSILFDSNGNQVRVMPETFDYLINPKENLFEDSYLELHASTDTLGNVQINNDFTIKFKEGYGISRNIGLGNALNFSYNGEYVSGNILLMNQVGNVLKELKYMSTDDVLGIGRFKYNHAYKFSYDKAYLVDENGNSLGLSGVVEYAIPFELYHGDEKLLSLGKIKDVKMFANSTDVSIKLKELVYSLSDNKSVYYMVESSNSDICSVEILDDRVMLKAIKEGTTNISLMATNTDNGGNTYTYHDDFDITVMEQPIDFSFKQDEAIDYIELKIKDGFMTDLGLLTSTVKLKSDNSDIPYKLEMVSDTIFKLYSVKEDKTVNFTKDKEYLISVGRWCIMDQNGTISGYLSHDFCYNLNVENRTVNKKSAVVSVVDALEAVLDLSQYFEDRDGDTITYSVSVDDLSKIDITHNNAELTIKPVDNGTAKLTVTATDNIANSEGNITEISMELICTVSGEGTKLLSMN